MPQIEANGIALEHEDYGDKAAPPILLVMGLGAQLTLWPVELVEALVERGFRVIRYDNRDIGLSQKMDGAKTPGFLRHLLMKRFGFNPKTPYSLADMAADGVGLMDALGIDEAHVVGASMGGMIAQHIAFGYPGRVLSLTSIMSTTGNPKLPPAQKEAIQRPDQAPCQHGGKRAGRTRDEDRSHHRLARLSSGRGAAAHEHHRQCPALDLSGGHAAPTRRDHC